MHMFDAFNPIVLSRQRARIDELFPQRFVENLAHERALAGTGRTGDRYHHAERKFHIDRLEVVFTSSIHGQRQAVAFAAILWATDRSLAREELSGRRRVTFENILDL